MKSGGMSEADLAMLAGQAPTGNRISSELSESIFRGAPGRGEIVGGKVDSDLNELLQLANKGGFDEAKGKLMMLLATSKYEGQVDADSAALKRLQEVQNRIDERIVCGFIAEVDACQQQYRGLPPDMIWNLNSFTLIKIIDALNTAGYRGNGMRLDPDRGTAR